jgi:TetR/AcrR family transcriptional repressor of nem operon
MGRTSDAKARLQEAVIDLIWVGTFAGTTVDDICQQAGVKKGSFYYFFESKSALVLVALEEMHAAWIARLNQEFSPLHSGLERLRIKARVGYEEQVELHARHGRVAGCPLFTIGSECVQVEPEVTRKIQKWIGEYSKFVESAVRDAHAAGEIDAPDAALTASTLMAYWQGVVARARILNDLTILRDSWAGAAQILRVTSEHPMAA